MKLELDKRIKSLSDVFNFSDVENAKQFIEQKGYFTNNIYFFKNIQSCKYGTLINVFSDSVSYNTFRRKEDGAYYEYFIPESFLKPKEKKFRPFTDTAEFFEKTVFEVGDVICIRGKNNSMEYHLMLVGWTKNEIMLGGSNRLDFKELFRWFELWDGEDKFIPFGVEE